MKIGVPDVPNNQIYNCMTTNATWKGITTAQGLTTQKFQSIVATKAMQCQWEPLATIDRGICLDVFNGNTLIDYLHDLENYIKYRCK
jgi:hypothetical protein